jgi:signal transduction histidine kinase
LRALIGISATVGVTLLLAWLMVQAFVVRPGIGNSERQRTRQVLAAAERMRSGVEKKAIEDEQGIDLRIFLGQPDQPPPGKGWIRQDTPDGVLWKRDGGKYDIAAWTAQGWVVIHEDPPYATTLGLAFLAVGVPVVLLMFGLNQRTQRHQEVAEQTLARMASGNLAERLDEQGGGAELRRVAVAVNRMAGQLQALLKSDRQRMAGLSHELRTPLTRIRLELELARREGGAVARLDRIERDIEAFDSMLAEMLELSQLELVGEEMMQLEVVDLAGLARLVIDEEGWREVEVRGTGEATVDSRLAARLIGNLLRNSRQHAPGALRWVEVGANRLAVGDDGPGIPVAERDEVFHAFRRGEASSGTGLGLAIVAQITALHGGQVHLSEPPGLTVRVEFAANPQARGGVGVFP